MAVAWATAIANLTEIERAFAHVYGCFFFSTVVVDCWVVVVWAPLGAALLSGVATGVSGVLVSVEFDVVVCSIVVLLDGGVVVVVAGGVLC